MAILAMFPLCLRGMVAYYSIVQDPDFKNLIRLVVAKGEGVVITCGMDKQQGPVV